MNNPSLEELAKEAADQVRAAIDNRREGTARATVEVFADIVCLPRAPSLAVNLAVKGQRAPR